jgi:hypothetical protein
MTIEKGTKVMLTENKKFLLQDKHKTTVELRKGQVLVVVKEMSPLLISCKLDHVPAFSHIILRKGEYEILKKPTPLYTKDRPYVISKHGDFDHVLFYEDRYITFQDRFRGRVSDALNTEFDIDAEDIDNTIDALIAIRDSLKQHS